MTEAELSLVEIKRVLEGLRPIRHLAQPCKRCVAPEECFNYGKLDGVIVGWFECPWPEEASGS